MPSYVPVLLAGMYVPYGAGTDKGDVHPARDEILRGTYITTEGVLTYAPPGDPSDWG